MLSLLLAVSATASMLLLLYVQRHYVARALRDPAADFSTILFTATAGLGAVAALAGLLIGVGFTTRIWQIIAKAESFIPPSARSPADPAVDELGALDAAVGRLSLSISRFVSDSDILAHLPQAMLVVGDDLSLLSYNESAETLFGRLTAYQHRSVLETDGLFPRPGNPMLAEVLTTVQATRGVKEQVELTATTLAGLRLVLDVVVQYHAGSTGATLVIFARDAAERQRIREELRRVDRLSFLGELAARLAHQIRTPLASSRVLIELLAADLDHSNMRQATYIQKILESIDRQDRLVEDLLTLSHPDPESWQPVALATLVRELPDAFGRDLRLKIFVPGGQEAGLVRGDAFRLHEVLMNLVRNAFEAISPTGTVEVRLDAADGGRIRLAVVTVGAGIPPAQQAKIFQPFFTTKPRGSGLGLAIARQIIEAHHGQLTATSDGHSMSTFVIELPTADVSMTVD
jgi:two-component system, NtrC family, sensor histidine kinase AtoS